MIAKRIVRERGASNFRRLGRYILDGAAEEEQAVMARMADYILGAEKSRAANVRFSNCISTDAELALKEILATQAMNKRAKGDRTYHLVISFPPGERPAPSQLEDIERVLCERIGLGGHQRLSATHLDTGHLHLHVAINKIHPESFRCAEPYYDKRRLMQTCVELEAKHGLIRTAHGEVLTMREATRTARQTMLALLQSNILPKLLMTGPQTWEELHRLLRDHGLELRLRGAGLVFQNTGGTVRVKASSVAREFSLKALTDKFGPYDNSVTTGMPLYRDLFTPRQLAAMVTFSDLAGEVRALVLEDANASPKLSGRPTPDKPLAEGGAGPVAYADAVVTYLSFAIDKCSDYSSSLCRWLNQPKNEIVGNTFGRQALPMVWSYAEANPFGKVGGAIEHQIAYINKALEANCITGRAGSVFQIDAAKNNYPKISPCISTDPPYYDNIGYADLSDYFYIWMRRSLRSIYPELLRRLETPKADELVATPYRHGGRDNAEAHFMKGMSLALAAMGHAANDNPLAIYYAYKQSETRSDGLLSPGWVAFLQAVVDAGLQVDGTWPVRSEFSGRLIASGTNALAASVVLVCRKRPQDAAAVGRRQFLRELKPVMADAILAHQKAGIPLPDRRQAAIGPGIGVFSKYSIVREADDSPMRVGTALALINKEVDALLSQGTEDLDAETRFALEWYQMHGYGTRKGGSGVDDDAVGPGQKRRHDEAHALAAARGRDRKHMLGAVMTQIMQALFGTVAPGADINPLPAFP